MPPQPRASGAIAALPTILVTGFNPFGGNPENPSELVVHTLATRPFPSAVLVTEVLPTEFVAATGRVQELLSRHQPKAIVCLGLASGRQSIQLERVALNLDDAQTPDNAEDLRVGRRIIEDGPVGYWSTLPLERLQTSLMAHGYDAVISNHAGTFLCNHVFYVLRHLIESQGRSIPCGFVHLPPLGPVPGSTAPAWTVERLADAVDLSLQTLSEP